MNKKGFTLIELLAVVVVLAIILAIAVPTITNIVNNSKLNAFEASAKLLLKAVRIKLLENNNFDLSTINKSTLESLLNIDSDNYSQVYVRSDSNGKLYTTLVGTGQWANLTVTGSQESVSVGASDQIVTSGLMTYLDAGNLASYNNGETKWYDISGNNNTAILYNGPTYNASNGGSLTCDGANDYADVPLPSVNNYNTITVEGFIKWYTSNGGMFFGMTTYDVWTYSSHLGYNNGASNVIGLNSTTVTSLGLIGNYKHYAFVMNKTGQLTTNKIYINGVEQTMTLAMNADGPIPGFSTNLRLCSWNSGNNFYGSITLGNLRVYNRELTSTEIQQNYNAQKARFGL